MSENDRRDEDSIEQSRPVQHSDIIPVSSSEVEAHRSLEDVISTLLVLMERLRWEEKELPRRAKYYPFPFVVDEDFIRKLDRRARERLDQAGILSGRTISVLGEIRFQDPNRVIILFTPVGSLADSREWCNSVDVNTFLLDRWELAFCLRPPWWLFKQVH